MAKENTSAGIPTPADASVTKDAQASSDRRVGKSANVEVRKPLQWSLWFRLTAIVLFALLYVWDLFEAVSNLFGKMSEVARVNEVRVLNGFASIDTPWAFLVVNLLLPLVVFTIALLVTRKRNVGILTMVLLAGLGVVAVGSLSITAFVLQTT